MGQKGERQVLDHTIASFSASPTYVRDQGVQHLVASTRAVSFRWVGHMVCIEVIGIPALKCQICDEQSYDLTLLHASKAPCVDVSSGETCEHRICLNNSPPN
ncbi:MAG TPA: hypothetical protein VFA09_19885 [Ktedonobacteraceae bacterium]|jgi:hypothetical protein|nr:hypothetical protein [Ktedonobacteraceae bacterium]